jgi:hypothetical protein
MVRLVLDGREYDLPPGTDAAALRRRAAEVMSGRAGNIGLDQITLADGGTLEVNWRVITIVQVLGTDGGTGP